MLYDMTIYYSMQSLHAGWHRNTVSLYLLKNNLAGPNVWNQRNTRRTAHFIRKLPSLKFVKKTQLDWLTP